MSTSTMTENKKRQVLVQIHCSL